MLVQESLTRDLFGRVENGAALPRNSGTAAAALGAIDQAGAAQQRGEILDLAVVVEDLVVQRGEELREAHPLLAAISSSVSQNDISSRIEVQWPPIRSDRVCDS